VLERHVVVSSTYDGDGSGTSSGSSSTGNTSSGNNQSSETQSVNSSVPDIDASALASSLTSDLGASIPEPIVANSEIGATVDLIQLPVNDTAAGEIAEQRTEASAFNPAAMSSSVSAATGLAAESHPIEFMPPPPELAAEMETTEAKIDDADKSAEANAGASTLTIVAVAGVGLFVVLLICYAAISRRSESKSVRDMNEPQIALTPRKGGVAFGTRVGSAAVVAPPVSDQI
jgi:hypothetical protein